MCSGFTVLWTCTYKLNFAASGSKYFHGDGQGSEARREPLISELNSEEWLTGGSLFHPRRKPLHFKTVVLSKDYFWLKPKYGLSCNLDVNLFPLHYFHKIPEKPQSLCAFQSWIPCPGCAPLLVSLQLLSGPLHPFLSIRMIQRVVIPLQTGVTL